MKPALADSAVVDVAVVAVEYVRRTHGFDELLRRLRRNSSPSTGLEHFWPEFMAAVYTEVIRDY